MSSEVQNWCHLILRLIDLIDSAPKPKSMFDLGLSMLAPLEQRGTIYSLIGDILGCNECITVLHHGHED